MITEFRDFLMRDAEGAVAVAAINALVQVPSSEGALVVSVGFKAATFEWKLQSLGSRALGKLQVLVRQIKCLPGCLLEPRACARLANALWLNASPH